MIFLSTEGERDAGDGSPEGPVERDPVVLDPPLPILGGSFAGRRPESYGD